MMSLATAVLSNNQSKGSLHIALLKKRQMDRTVYEFPLQYLMHKGVPADELHTVVAHMIASDMTTMEHVDRDLAFLQK